MGREWQQKGMKKLGLEKVTIVLYYLLFIPIILCYILQYHF